MSSIRITTDLWQTDRSLGPFYEIESSSPAKELKKGESLEHKQTICHFEGDYQSLNLIAQKLLGINLDEIKSSLHL